MGCARMQLWLLSLSRFAGRAFTRQPRKEHQKKKGTLTIWMDGPNWVQMHPSITRASDPNETLCTQNRVFGVLPNAGMMATDLPSPHQTNDVTYGVVLCKPARAL